MKYISIVILLFLTSFTAFSQDKPAGKVLGYVFGDYFYKFAGDSSGSGSQYSLYRKDFQAFQLRRLYLYYDHTFDETFSAQFL